ncbi:MAG: DUF971 domain-containing protein [Planctomycetota bacterium]|jgi:DUF971 family protein
MAAQPTSLSLKENVLTIEWDDGRRLEYDTTWLRRNCRCATCNSERSRAIEEADEPLDLSGAVGIGNMTPVGNYAYKIVFTDGHSTGLFTLEVLERLGRETPA